VWNLHFRVFVSGQDNKNSTAHLRGIEWSPCGQHLFLIHYSKLHIIIIIDGFSIIIFFSSSFLIIFQNIFVFVFAFSCFREKKRRRRKKKTLCRHFFPLDIHNLIHYATRKETNEQHRGGHTTTTTVEGFKGAVDDWLRFSTPFWNFFLKGGLVETIKINNRKIRTPSQIGQEKDGRTWNY
jgi:hypothetical protein